MRRVSTILFSIAVVCGTLLAGVMLAVPRDAASQVEAVHPIVGSWILDADLFTEDEPPSLVTFSSDGTYLEIDSDGSTGVGVWEATGESTATLTFRFVDDTGFAVIRASAEVAADGNSFTADFTLQFMDFAGASAGEYGPGTATATRVVPEAPGTPDGSFEDLFALFEGTPEASPAP